MAVIRIFCWAFIFIVKLCFSPGLSLAFKLRQQGLSCCDIEEQNGSCSGVSNEAFGQSR